MRRLQRCNCNCSRHGPSTHAQLHGSAAASTTASDTTDDASDATKVAVHTFGSLPASDMLPTPVATVYGALVMGMEVGVGVGAGVSVASAMMKPTMPEENDAASMDARFTLAARGNMSRRSMRLSVTNATNSGNTIAAKATPKQACEICRSRPAARRGTNTNSPRP